MKEKIEKTYTEALEQKLSPDEFSKRILSLFGLNTEGSLSLPFDAIVHPHYAQEGHLDGGICIDNGIVTGYIGVRGHTGFSFPSGYPKRSTNKQKPKHKR